jgi:hypothetical protein
LLDEIFGGLEFILFPFPFFAQVIDCFRDVVFLAVSDELCVGDLAQRSD